MKCVADRDYEVVRNKVRIVYLKCKYCYFSFMIPRHWRKDNGKRCGALGRYNVAHGLMVKHLHEKHGEIIKGF